MSSRSVHSRAEYAPGRFGDGGAQHRFDLGFCATSTPGRMGSTVVAEPCTANASRFYSLTVTHSDLANGSD